ncbi:hypothetical protein G6F54_014402 [Rhizopus delemar]|nr:hypothetical protein G6F54_014402 [Rhizopus delemar]
MELRCFPCHFAVTRATCRSAPAHKRGRQTRQRLTVAVRLQQEEGGQAQEDKEAQRVGGEGEQHRRPHRGVLAKAGTHHRHQHAD